LARPDTDESARDKGAKRVANDAPADTEELTELRFGREPMSRSRIPHEDPLLEVCRDAVAETAASAEARERRRDVDAAVFRLSLHESLYYV